MASTEDRLRWYVVHTKPGRELMVSGLIESQLALEVYLPEVVETRRNRRRKTPLFPRYLFVRVDLARTPGQAINTLPGVIHLVSFGGYPQPLADREVDTLIARLDALNAQGGLPTHAFHPGDEVRLLDGPLQGLEAVFIGPMTPTQRVRVLLDFLGTEREAEVALESIERVPRVRRGRRTRGQGRRIRTQPALDKRDDGM
jgi:transcriptional antiterminator RfaH